MYHHWFWRKFSHTQRENRKGVERRRKSELICTVANKMLLHYVKSALWSFLILSPIKAAHTFTLTCSLSHFFHRPPPTPISFTYCDLRIYVLNSIHNFLNFLSRITFCLFFPLRCFSMEKTFDGNFFISK